MQKNYLLIIILLVICMAPSLRAQVSFGSPEKINDNWKFILNDVQDGQSATLDDTRWQQISLPHDWSVKGQLSPTLASCMGTCPEASAGIVKQSIFLPTDSIPLFRRGL